MNTFLLPPTNRPPVSLSFHNSSNFLSSHVLVTLRDIERQFLLHFEKDCKCFSCWFTAWKSREMTSERLKSFQMAFDENDEVLPANFPPSLNIPLDSMDIRFTKHQSYLFIIIVGGLTSSFNFHDKQKVFLRQVVAKGNDWKKESSAHDNFVLIHFHVLGWLVFIFVFRFFFTSVLSRSNSNENLSLSHYMRTLRLVQPPQ